jgi:hypothetical protein
MMEAVSDSEPSVIFCDTTRRSIPEDSHSHTRRCENLKSYFLSTYFELLKPQKTSVRIAGLRAEIGTRDLLNTMLEC